MSYGSGQDWMIADHEESIRQIKYAYDQGINVSSLQALSPKHFCRQREEKHMLTVCIDV